MNSLQKCDVLIVNYSKYSFQKVFFIGLAQNEPCTWISKFVFLYTLSNCKLPVLI